jgi:class 3 adenylate cyclase
MEEHEIKRKLATIMVADIVGFSRLTAANEDWTIHALGEFRVVVDGIIARHDGRIFNTGGDSVLAEFASPVEAVRCAVDFHEAARPRNLLRSPDRQLRFRIGINLGDVMVRGSDLLGDGVNVAARLEGIAEPGGICVSGSVWDHVNRLGRLVHREADARWTPQNIASVPDVGLRRPSRDPVVDACGTNRRGANRSSWPSRAHHRLCCLGGDRDGGLWTKSRGRADHRLLLAVCRRPGIPQNFSPGRNPALVDFAASALGAVCGGPRSSSSGTGAQLH